jgi:hypothetical protein
MAKCTQHIAIGSGFSQPLVLGRDVPSRNVDYDALCGLWPVSFSSCALTVRSVLVD